MIVPDMYVTGFITGASVMLMLAIGALTIQRRELWRVRKRLKGICDLASQQNEAMQQSGARRGAPDGEHWCELVAEIQPYEEA